jgi:hypothetical protein
MKQADQRFTAGGDDWLKYTKNCFDDVDLNDAIDWLSEMPSCSCGNEKIIQRYPKPEDRHKEPTPEQIVEIQQLVRRSIAEAGPMYRCKAFLPYWFEDHWDEIKTIMGGDK